MRSFLLIVLLLFSFPTEGFSRDKKKHKQRFKYDQWQSPDSFAIGPKWIREQIQEDLAYLAKKPMSSRELEEWFNIFSARGAQALYCQIRNHKISWRKTSRSDEWRNPHIFQYIANLNAKYPLPDTDFVLITDDGLSVSLEIPVFAFAKSVTADNVMLFPDFEMFWEVNDPSKGWLSVSEQWSNEYPWETKQSCAFFRGVSTGGYDSSRSDFGNDRARMVLFSHAHPELVDATFNTVFQGELRDFLNSINKPIAGAAVSEHYRYKYLLDIDGNSCTYSRCRWILLSNSTLVKMESPNKQWYYKALEPWVHYVPVKRDLTDLEQTLHFLNLYNRLACRIAKQGQELGKTLFSQEMIDAYVFQLLCTYAKYVTVN